MSAQHVCTRRCIVTLVAFVKLFSTVRFQMSPQHVCTRRGIVTLLAFVWLFSTVFIWVIFPRTCLFFGSFTVTKRLDFFQVFSTVLKRLCPLQFTLQKNFGVPCSTPVFALLSDFWVKIRALVRPNRERWTGFDLLIISGVKF